MEKNAQLGLTRGPEFPLDLERGGRGKDGNISHGPCREAGLIRQVLWFYLS